LEGREIDSIGIFYGHLECILAIWYVMWHIGNLLFFWYIFPCFGILYHQKSGNLAVKEGIVVTVTVE
jgi:hypothetical protein